MLTINDKKYAEHDREFTDSLFHKDGTCVGFYKINEVGVHIYDHQQNLFAFLVCRNQHTRPSGAFFVSASAHSDGRKRYLFGLSSVDARKLGMEGYGVRQQWEVAQEVVRQIPKFAPAAPTLPTTEDHAIREQARILNTWNFR